jgi:deoxyribodipyrimidine photo-lyase
MLSPASVPTLRVRAVNDVPVRGDRDFVLHWMIAYPRTNWNFALERAVEHARELGKPLVILEALRCGHRWASDRLHRFVLDGMAQNARALEGKPCAYWPWVERTPGEGRGLLRALAERACVIVTDDFPAFFLPRMIAAAGREVPARLEAVDSNGLLPLRAADRAFPTAHAFRRFLQKTLPAHLAAMPKPDPLARIELPRPPAMPREIAARWPRASAKLLAGEGLAALPIDHSIAPIAERGGSAAASRALRRFVRSKLARYAEDRNDPDLGGSSGLSPWLHFGHLSAHEVFREVMRAEEWSPTSIAPKATGSKEGWWGASAAAEAFLDELVTWREVGFNFCSQRGDHDRYESLPDWARATLEAHALDRRPVVYDLATLEGARTHDAVWNAAQSQLVRDGRIHNYLRMLWGKKILEWSPSPRAALDVMIELNDRFAVDGRDPNSTSGIFWVLGRYDRPWFPERPIFGTVRYMSSDNTRRKLRLREYLASYAT